MTKLFTDFFVNACKYGELFVYLSFARSGDPHAKDEL